MDYVLGHDFCLIGNKELLTTNFNMALLGQLLVVFEELSVQVRLNGQK